MYKRQPVYNKNSDGSYDLIHQIGSWAGDIEIINVTNGGSGYQSNVAVTVTITGDGTGASAYAQIANGAISDIIVTNTGQNYTYANVSITSASGSGAIATAPVSPIGGHGFDPVSEFGCNHTMFTCEFNGSENGTIPTSIQYQQVGIIVNPLSKSSYPVPATGTIYDASTKFVVAPGFGSYLNDEMIYQGSSLATATFSATCLSFDPVNNIISLINITGTPALNLSVFGDTSGTARTLLSISNPDILLPSGYVTYIENRSGIQRSSDGIEQFKFVLGY